MNQSMALKISQNYSAPAGTRQQKRQFLKITLQSRFLARSEIFLQL